MFYPRIQYINVLSQNSQNKRYDLSLYVKYTKMSKYLLSSILQSSIVWTPVFKTVVSKLTDNIQSFLPRYIPVPSFLNI